MKARLITGVVAGSIFIAFLCGMYTPAYPVLVLLMSCLSVYEIERCVGMKDPFITVITLLMAGVIPFVINYDLIQTLHLPVYSILAAYLLISCSYMVIRHKTLNFDALAVSLFSSVAVTMGFSSFIYLRDVYILAPDKYTKPMGVFLVLFGMFASWFTDIFAYFTGRAFGKHKLCPEISPKKTVEGAIGGIIGAAVMDVALFLVFKRFWIPDDDMHVWQIIVISVVLSVISMFGDLSASCVKRHHNVKDYGWILPGHGGVMDRFDSTLFVMPTLYAVILAFAKIG